MLTIAEAQALAFMAGNVADYEDSLQSTFPHWRARACALGAYNKLLRALGRTPLSMTLRGRRVTPGKEER